MSKLSGRSTKKKAIMQVVYSSVLEALKVPAQDCRKYQKLIKNFLVLLQLEQYLTIEIKLFAVDH
jgi:hypothetical protein